MAAMSCQQYRDISKSVWCPGDQEARSCSEDPHPQAIRDARQKQEGETFVRSEISLKFKLCFCFWSHVRERKVCKYLWIQSHFKLSDHNYLNFSGVVHPTHFDIFDKMFPKCDILIWWLFPASVSPLTGHVLGLGELKVIEKPRRRGKSLIL